MTLGSSGCDQCMGSVGVITECGQWVVDLLDYLIMKYPAPLVSVLNSSIPFNFCKVRNRGNNRTEVEKHRGFTSFNYYYYNFT